MLYVLSKCHDPRFPKDRKRQLFRDALERDPTLSWGWVCAAYFTPTGRAFSATVDGQPKNFGVRECALQALKCDPENSEAYHYQAELCGDNETIDLNGAPLNKRQLRVRAIEFGWYDGWGFLLHAMHDGERVVVKGCTYERRAQELEKV